MVAREHPELIGSYRAIYARGSYADRRYRRLVAERVGPLLRRHGLAPRPDRLEQEQQGDEHAPAAGPDAHDTRRATWPTGSLPAGTRTPANIDEDQLSLM